MKYMYTIKLIDYRKSSVWTGVKLNTNIIPEAELLLNEMGMDGWELVSILPIAEGNRMVTIGAGLYHFKKSIP